MSNLPTIDVIFPVRNRSFILDHFLSCIYSLDYPKDKISIITYLNDSNDSSEEILNNFKKKYKNEYKKIDIKKYDLNTPEYIINEDGDRGRKIQKSVTNKFGTKTFIENEAHAVYKSLAKLRNHLIYKTTSDYVFSVDTDIMFQPDILNKLLSHEVDMVSALICNGYIYSDKYSDPEKEKINPYTFLNIMHEVESGKYSHISNCINAGLLEVSLTGAISLMSKKLCKSGVKYDFSIFGEDAPFCKSAIDKGFKIYCDTDIQCIHIMSPKYLKKYLAGEFTF